MGELKTKKQKIEYFKKLIKIARRTAREERDKDYLELVKHYQKEIRKVKGDA